MCKGVKTTRKPAGGHVGIVSCSLNILHHLGSKNRILSLVESQNKPVQELQAAH